MLRVCYNTDAPVDWEPSLKLGLARSDFNQLQRLWGHSDVSLFDKLKILQRFRFVEAKMWTCCCLAGDSSAPEVGCICGALFTQSFLRIPASFASLISNAAVLARAGVTLFPSS